MRIQVHVRHVVGRDLRSYDNDDWAIGCESYSAVESLQALLRLFRIQFADLFHRVLAIEFCDVRSVVGVTAVASRIVPNLLVLVIEPEFPKREPHRGISTRSQIIAYND
jgi:hypothetical protein